MANINNRNYVQAQLDSELWFVLVVDFGPKGVLFWACFFIHFPLFWPAS